jgi:hypothetical protein
MKLIEYIKIYWERENILINIYIFMKEHTLRDCMTFLKQNILTNIHLGRESDGKIRSVA